MHIIKESKVINDITIPRAVMVGGLPKNSVAYLMLKRLAAFDVNTWRIISWGQALSAGDIAWLEGDRNIPYQAITPEAFERFIRNNPERLRETMMPSFDVGNHFDPFDQSDAIGLPMINQ